MANTLVSPVIWNLEEAQDARGDDDQRERSAGRAEPFEAADESSQTGRVEEYRGTLLNRENDSPLDGLEELISALHDIGEILERPALARIARIARAAEQVTGLWPA
jgi:hypothetical protein